MPTEITYYYHGLLEFKHSTPDADITGIRRSPLLRIAEDTYAILDAGFVLDKAGRSLFWTALKGLEEHQRKRTLGLWGELFELYVNNLFTEAPHPGRRVIPNPRFADGAEAMDCCILERGTLIAIESKASTLAASVRYADDPQRLKVALEKAFVVGDESGPKGLSQIANFLIRFSRGDPIYDSKRASVVKRVHIHKIIPVLIHLDIGLRTFRMNHWMAQELKDRVRIKRPVVTPLALVPITELEELQGWLGELLLSDILESYLRKLRLDPTTVFFADQVPIMHGKERRSGPAQRRMDQILDGMRQRLFPGE